MLAPFSVKKPKPVEESKQTDAKINQSKNAKPVETKDGDADIVEVPAAPKPNVKPKLPLTLDMMKVNLNTYMCLLRRQCILRILRPEQEFLT